MSQQDGRGEYCVIKCAQTSHCAGAVYLDISAEFSRKVHIHSQAGSYAALHRTVAYYFSKIHE